MYSDTITDLIHAQLPGRCWGIELAGERGYRIEAHLESGLVLALLGADGQAVKTTHYSLPAGRERDVPALCAAFEAAADAGWQWSK